MALEDVDAAFRELFDDIVEMSALDATWLRIAGRILGFCSEYAPAPEVVAGLPGGQPEGEVLAVEALALAALAAADADLASALADFDGGGFRGPLSFASESVRWAICEIAQREADSPAFGDRRLGLVVIARALAGAVDELAGHTFLPWFRAQGEVTLTEGQPYPVRHHDPRPWLGLHGANSDPANTPDGDFAHTGRLRIATRLPFKCVIDFDWWNRMSALGSEGRLIVAAAQPNTWLNEFRLDFDEGPPRSYVNLGPADVERQALRISVLAEHAYALSADVLLLPEYSLSEAVHTELLTLNKDGTWLRPMIICAGAVDDVDDEYVNNHGKLIVNSPGMEHDYSADTPSKSHQAPIGGAIERIRRGSEVRVYTGERWTMCVLICRDAIDNAVVEQLARIGANLLLVPALSPRTATLVDSATVLCHRSQAFVVIANGPARWGSEALQERPAQRLEAVFAGPYDESPNHVGVTSTTEVVTGGGQTVWAFDFAKRIVTSRVLYND